jgi:hypothetical protein
MAANGKGWPSVTRASAGVTRKNTVQLKTENSNGVSGVAGV